MASRNSAVVEPGHGNLDLLTIGLRSSLPNDLRTPGVSEIPEQSERVSPDADLKTLIAAREKGRTVLEMVRADKKVAHILARYGIYTTMGNRDPGSWWAHRRREKADRAQAGMAKLAIEAMERVPGLEHIARRPGVELAMLFSAARGGRPEGIHIANPKVARFGFGKRRGRVVDGVVTARSVAYFISPDRAQTLSDVLQVLGRSQRREVARVARIRPLGDRSEVSLTMPTEYTNRSIGNLVWYLLRKEFEKHGFVAPDDKRPIGETSETFHPSIAGWMTELTRAYRRMGSPDVKDRSLLPQEAAVVFTNFRDYIRDQIRVMRGRTDRNKEQNRDDPLAFEGDFKLSRGKVKFGQSGPGSLQGRSVAEATLDYARDTRKRFKDDPIGEIGNALASIPNGLVEAARFVIAKLLPGTVIWTKWLVKDAISYRRKKQAAIKDTSVDDLIDRLSSRTGIAY